MTLLIEGLAVPYNCQNSWGETILPGAFTKFLESARQGGHLTSDGEINSHSEAGLLPMLWQHQTRIGSWTHVFDSDKGLVCRGRVEIEKFEPLIIHNLDKLGLSITYTTDEPLSRRGRLKSGVNFSPGQKAESWMFNPITITDAGFDEVTITPDPAFAGTYIKITGRT